MSREYAELARLPGGHNGAITVISFSPRATYLATAATDDKICIWEAASRKLLHRYHGSSYALCLAWMPNREDHLLCGMLDGYVVCLSFSPRTIRAQGLVIHTSPVEAIAILENRVASGSRRDIRVWDWHADGKWHSVGRWLLHHEVEEPPTSSQEEEVSIAHLHWITLPRHTRLAVVYMEHGVRIFDARTWKFPYHSIHPFRLSQCYRARADVSIDGEYLALANPLSGFGLYSLRSGDLVRAFGHEVGFKRATPVKFIESGKAIIGGSTVGEVNIWDIETGRKVQTLLHTGTSFGELSCVVLRS
ncbi:WD40-repeat-containing domain protein [Cerioporus squamosus]|nr:WD40-repeat-containing domain protein [Cerioporus squamosus]